MSKLIARVASSELLSTVISTSCFVAVMLQFGRRSTSATVGSARLIDMAENVCSSRWKREAICFRHRHAAKQSWHTASEMLNHYSTEIDT